MSETKSKVRPEVKVGQLWKTNDPRSASREFRVIEIRETAGTPVLVHADYGFRKVWIKRDRFLPWQKKGYTLVADVQ